MEDLDQWVVLPEDGFLEINDDCSEGKKFFSRKYTTPSDSVFKNYFMCPSSPTKFMESTPVAAGEDKADCRVVNNKQYVPVPVPISIQLEEQDMRTTDGGDDKKKIPPNDHHLMIYPSSSFSSAGGTGQDLFSQQQVFFKKETEFVDMKLDSPKSSNNNNSNNMNWGMNKPSPQLMVQFEAAAAAAAATGGGGGEGPETMKISSPRKMMKVGDEKDNMDYSDIPDGDGKKEGNWDDEDEEGEDRNPGGVKNILKWSLTGIGAICSFGVATVCIFVLGGLIRNSPSASSNKQLHHHQDHRQKFQLHIYAEDKRLKEVVHRATKLNEAITAAAAARGVPFTRAHITFGGYFDAP